MGYNYSGGNLALLFLNFHELQFIYTVFGRMPVFPGIYFPRGGKRMAYPATAAAAAAEPGVLFVAIMGICTVLISLVCIILLCMLMSRVCRLLERIEKPALKHKDAAPNAQAAVPAPIPNREELVAAVTAALAEELGTDVSAIRVLSFRRADEQAAPAANPQRGELVAAITAAVAEELGTDVSAIRIHSLRKLN